MTPSQISNLKISTALSKSQAKGDILLSYTQMRMFNMEKDKTTEEGQFH